VHEARTGTAKGTFELLYCAGISGELRVAVQGLATCPDAKPLLAPTINMAIEMAKSMITVKWVFIF